MFSIRKSRICDLVISRRLAGAQSRRRLRRYCRQKLQGKLTDVSSARAVSLIKIKHPAKEQSVIHIYRWNGFVVMFCYAACCAGDAVLARSLAFGDLGEKLANLAATVSGVCISALQFGQLRAEEGALTKSSRRCSG